MAPIPGGAALCRLRTALEGVLNSWDVVLLDCPPSLGQLTVNALTAADAAVLVTEAWAASVEAWRR